jgi:DNA-binding NarL/FixJ family response regulator
VTAVHARQRILLLLELATCGGVAGDEERVVACQRELAVLTEPAGEFAQRMHYAFTLRALGMARWRRGNLDQAAEPVQQCLRLREGLTARMGNASCLETLAWIAASQHQHERAAVLLGAAGHLRQSVAIKLHSYGRLRDYQRDCERQARQALGETAFQAAYHRGLEMPEEDAVAYALQRSSAPRQSPEKSPVRVAPGPEPGAGLLTPRELEVARLIAEGCGNKEIAARLVISQRTAEGHVEHIMTKLGFTSRVQVAAWVIASRPEDG